MSFYSYIFILAFLPATLCVFHGLRRLANPAAAKWALLAACAVFYGYAGMAMLGFLAAAIGLNYAAHRAIMRFRAQGRMRRAHWAARAAVAANIGALCYCKYMDFFIGNLSSLLQRGAGALTILIPLGLSFITFQQIAFIVDTKRGGTPVYAFLDYALFVGFFPKVLSGPIALHDELAPQFAAVDGSGVDWEKFSRGLTLLSLGLGKKVLVADTFGKAADWGYAAEIPALGAVNAWCVVLAYSFQIYFDFSGYCDMASGISGMLGFSLPQNFNSPYQALSISDFWKRWHMTLTRFLTKYVYIPLGGSRRGAGRTYAHILLVFLVSGLWHGAEWSFILWGLLHGAAMCADRFRRRESGASARRAPPHPAAAWLCTFLFVSLAWVYFRAPDIAAGTGMLRQLLNFQQTALAPQISDAFILPEIGLLLKALGLSAPKGLIAAAFYALSFTIVLNNKNAMEYASGRLAPGTAMVCVLSLVWSVLSFGGVSEFVYGAF